jgi:phosphoribosylformylglycinamidine (FGAM) synthase PurS component
MIKEKIDKVYMGKDVRIFNKKLIKNELEDIYNKILNEMNVGFSKIQVLESEKEKIEQICQFLCINPVIEII